MNSDNLKKSLLSTESSEFTVFQIKADATTILDLEDDKFLHYDYLCEIQKKKKNCL